MHLANAWMWMNHKSTTVANLSQGAVVTFLELHLLQELREHPRVLQLWALLGQCHLHTAEPERNTNAHASEHRSLNNVYPIEAETHTSSPRRSGVQEAAECEDVPLTAQMIHFLSEVLQLQTSGLQLLLQLAALLLRHAHRLGVSSQRRLPDGQLHRLQPRLQTGQRLQHPHHLPMSNSSVIN